MGIQTVSQALSNENGGFSPFGFKNRIINGAMVIDQRNAGAVHTPTSTLYCVDRWHVAMSQNSKFTAQQNAGAVTPPAGFVNYQGITSSSAYSLLTTDYFVLRQAIEGNNVSDLDFGTANAKTITVSFWVRSSLTGTFGGALYNGNGTRSYPFSYTINVANTWEYKTITIPGDTTGTWAATTGAGLYVSFSLGAGSTYNSPANAWAGGFYTQPSGSTSVVSSNAATWYVTGVQLEKGPQATAFDYRDYGNELRMCQRYYEKSFEPGSVPTSAGSAAGAFEFAQQVAASAQQYGPSCKYSVVKRSTPTVTFYNWNAAGSQAVNVVTAGTTTSLALRAGQSGVSSYSITFIAPAGTSAGQGLSVQWTADSEL